MLNEAWSVRNDFGIALGNVESIKDLSDDDRSRIRAVLNGEMPKACNEDKTAEDAQIDALVEGLSFLGDGIPLFRDRLEKLIS